MPADKVIQAHSRCLEKEESMKLMMLASTNLLLSFI